MANYPLTTTSDMQKYLYSQNANKCIEENGGETHDLVNQSKDTRTTRAQWD